MKIASRMNRIQPSPSLGVTKRAAELAAEGKDIITLSLGEPDFPTPEHINQAAKQAIDRGETKYTPVHGTMAVREAIVEKFRRDNGIAYSTSEIAVSCGGKQIVYNALMATLDPGDEVIIPAPYWVSYPDIVLLAEGTPVYVDCPSQAGFQIQPEQLEAAITPRTRWLILNSPGNPTGSAYSESALRGLAEVLRAHPDVCILSDDIYEFLVYDGFEFATLAQVAPDLKDRTITLNGVSKGYCMTGWRLGFAGGPRELITEMDKIQSQSTTHTCSVTQAATVAALTGPHDFIARNNARFAARRDMVVEALNRIPGISCERPNGAFYVFPSCAGLIGKQTPQGKLIETDSDIVHYLLEHAGVAAVQGEAFGLSPHFRISTATSDTLLREACERIATACAALS